MLCHSVRCCFSPFSSFQTSSVARLKRARVVPPCVYFTSGSLPNRPTKITLLTELLMPFLLSCSQTISFQKPNSFPKRHPRVWFHVGPDYLHHCPQAIQSHPGTQ